MIWNLGSSSPLSGRQINLRHHCYRHENVCECDSTYYHRTSDAKIDSVQYGTVQYVHSDIKCCVLVEARE